MNYSFASTNNKKPDKTPLILDRVGPPKTPPGYRAIFFDGQWQIVPTTGGVTIAGSSGVQAPSGKKGGSGPRPGTSGGSGGGGVSTG